MAEASHDYYRLLGLTRNAKPEEIRRAYERLRTAMREEAAAPDPRRVVLLQNAYEVLSDEARRREYDASLREARPPRSARHRAWEAGILGAVLALAAIFYFSGRGRDEPAARARTEILSAVSVAVGRAQAVDLAGRATPIGIAFATAPGRLVTACVPLAPNAALLVRIGHREVPARVGDASGTKGYCTLDAPDTGSWPLDLARALPDAGDKVYAARVGASGEVTLAEGRVDRIERAARGAVLELSGEAAGAERGAPILDEQGRVAAMSRGDGRAVALHARASSG
jgi:hypothetical protein